MIRACFLSLITLVCAGVASADVVIDFEALQRVDANFESIGSTYTEDGFILSEANGGDLGNVGTLEARYSGSTAVSGIESNALFVLNQVGGGSFGVDSIDLSEFGGGSATVSFTGILSGGGVASQSFTLDGTNFAPESFNFDSSFDSVVALVWLQSTPTHQFDNIGITTTAIPEPASGIVLVAMAAFAFRRRR